MVSIPIRTFLEIWLMAKTLQLFDILARHTRLWDSEPLCDGKSQFYNPDDLLLDLGHT